jgi:hypothetical protein
MAPIPTAEHAVRRIAAKCAPSTSPAHSASRPEPAAAIQRRHGEQFRRAPAQADAGVAEIAAVDAIGVQCFGACRGAALDL